MKHIVKREGHKEPYNKAKVYRSVFRSCLNAHLTEGRSEEIANKVADKISGWINSGPKVVSSGDISEKVEEELKKHNKDAAFMYETHMDVS